TRPHYGVAGDHFLGARGNDHHAEISDRTVGRNAQLQNGVALARVEPVLADERAGPARRHRLAEEARAPREIVDHLVQPLDDTRRGHSSRAIIRAGWSGAS